MEVRFLLIFLILLMLPLVAGEEVSMDFEVFDTLVISTISVTGFEPGDEFYQSFSFENDFVEVDSMISSDGIGNIDTFTEFPTLFEKFEIAAMVELSKVEPMEFNFSFNMSD